MSFGKRGRRSPSAFGGPIDPHCNRPSRCITASSAFHQSGRMPEPWCSLRPPAPDASALPSSPSRRLAALPFPLLATPLRVCRSPVFLQGAHSLPLSAQRPLCKFRCGLFLLFFDLFLRRFFDTGKFSQQFHPVYGVASL